MTTTKPDAAPDHVPAHELRAHARRTRMPSSCLRVYDALLDHRGKNPTAWVANRTLQEETGLDETTVRRACRALERHGWLVLVDDGRRVNEYQLTTGTAIASLLVRSQPVDADAPLAGHRCPPAKMPPQPGTDAPRGGHGCAPQGGHGCPPNSSVELFKEQVPPIVPQPGDPGRTNSTPTATPEPEPMQAELLSTPSPAPKPKSRPGPKPKPDPEQDPTWTTFAALAVESGHVTQPPKAGAKTYRKNRNRGQVLAELVAEHGADDVLAVWRHTLTSPRETPGWWREHLQGPALVDAFLAGSAYAKLANDLEAARDIERKAQRPRLTVVATALPVQPPPELFLAVCESFRVDTPTADAVARLVPDEALRSDVLALALAVCPGDIRLGFAHGRDWAVRDLERALPEARTRYAAWRAERQPTRDEGAAARQAAR